MSTPEPEVSAATVRRRGLLRGLIVAVALLIVMAVGVLAIRQWFAPLGEDRPGDVAAVRIGGPFTLVDHHGRTVTDADFRGRYMLIYFGYTFCPDVCPTSLSRNFEALDLLGDKAEAIVPILISVDPERDTPEHLRDYVTFFGDGLIGLTGSAEQIRAVADAYRVYYAKAKPESTDAPYLVDHSSFTYLMAPDGRFVQFFRHETGAADMAERLRKLL
jgi:protein SCO1/2